MCDKRRNSLKSLTEYLVLLHNITSTFFYFDFKAKLSVMIRGEGCAIKGQKYLTFWQMTNSCYI